MRTRARIVDPNNLNGRIQTRRRVPASLVVKKNFRSIRFHMRRRIIYMTLFSLSFSILTYPTIPVWLQVANKGLSLQHENYIPTWENGILPVCYYYVQNIGDNYVTVCFRSGPLMYFANRSIIDLGSPYGIQTMQNILTINTSGELLEALNKSNIRYFLIPTSNSSFYNQYLGFRENFYLFRLIEQDRHFSLVKEFSYYKLVRLESAV